MGIRYGVVSKLFDFLTGTKILEEVDSPINGRLTVVQDLAWGVYIKAGGLTQSGGVAKKVWETTLKRIKNQELFDFGVGGREYCRTD